MTCPHDITERDVAVSADGYCPLCMATEIERLRAVSSELHAEIKRLNGDVWKQLAELEHLRALVKTLADRVEKLAFDMPAPNEYTPQFVMLANAARRALGGK